MSASLRKQAASNSGCMYGTLVLVEEASAGVRDEIGVFAALAQQVARDKFISNSLYVKSAKCSTLGGAASAKTNILQVTDAAKYLYLAQGTDQPSL